MKHCDEMNRMRKIADDGFSRGLAIGAFLAWLITNLTWACRGAR